MAIKNDIEPDDIKSIPTFRAAYSDRTALLMAKLAYRAYEKFDANTVAFGRFQQDFARLGLVDCTGLVDADTGTAGYVAAGPDIIVVAFRGTEDLLDWWTNVHVAWIVLQGGVKVHTGFFQAYYPIRENLFAAVRQLLKSKPRPVYITGHSLGGALAIMATAELANHEDAEVRDSIAACYTFGCPKAGDRSFDQYVRVPLYRITNGVDLVPAVPPPFTGYKHVGDTRYFGKGGIPPLRRPPNILQKLWRTAWGLLAFLRTRKILNIADHAMAVYIAKLDAWAKASSVEALERRKATADPEF
jgi:triacylglycerol lipase